LIAVFLDAGPLSDAARKPGQRQEADDLQEWLRRIGRDDIFYFVAEVSDFEVRRELLRAGKTSSIQRLERLIEPDGCYVPITTEAMREAASLWAQARIGGITTAPPDALDGDVILAAQVRVWARAMSVPLSEVVVATSNPAHLSRFVPADLWTNL
jgi:predicted nucleic acid-binding protein